MDMVWIVTYPRKWNKETRSHDEPRIEQGQDCEDLLFLIEEAFNAGEEISVELGQWDPSDYIAARDSEGVTTASDYHSAAWAQHVAMHS